MSIERPALEIYIVTLYSKYMSGEEFLNVRGFFKNHEDAYEFIVRDMEKSFHADGINQETSEVDYENYIIESGNDMLEWSVFAVELPEWLQIKEAEQL